MYPPGQSQPVVQRTVVDNVPKWILIVAVLLGAALHFVSAFISRGKKAKVQNAPSENGERQELVNKLNQAESSVRHWEDEVRNVQLQSDGQIKIRDDQLSERGSKIADLEQKLRVAQNNLDGFTHPRGRLKLKLAKYHLPGKVQFGLDVLEMLDRMVLDEKLELDRGYNEIFRIDPYPGVPKFLTIEFSHGLREFSVTIPENTKLTLPLPYGEVA